MRYGKTTFSKSKMMNAILSPSGHNVFFHKEGPCGREKRFISNGSVEMSHFLPSGGRQGGRQGSFEESALFFNLRGDACDYPVQHGIMMDIASVLVIVVDLLEVTTGAVNELLNQLRKKDNITFVLTNSTGLLKYEMVQAVKTLQKLVGVTASKDTFIPIFEECGLRNDTDLTEHIISAIRIKMEKSHKRAVEDLGKTTSNYIVDEIMNSDCSSGNNTKICSPLAAAGVRCHITLSSATASQEKECKMA